MSPRSIVVALLSLGLVLMPWRAYAQGSTALPIEWTSQAHCDRPDNLDAEIRNLLGPNVEAPPQWRFVIDVSPDDTSGAHPLQVLLRVTTTSSERQRRIAVGSCDEAARTAVVLIAVAIDPTLASALPADVATSDAREDDNDHATNEPARDNEAAQSPTESNSATDDKTRWGLGASLGIDIARLPAPTLELSARGVVRRRNLRVELLATWLPTTIRDVPERENASLRLQTVSIATRPCMLGDLGGLRMGPCAIARAGLLFGDAAGVDSSAPKTTWLLSAGLAGVIEWPLSRHIALDLIWGGELSLVRPTFRVMGSTASHTLPLLSTQVGVGLLAVFE